MLAAAAAAAVARLDRAQEEQNGDGSFMLQLGFRIVWQGTVDVQLHATLPSGSGHSGSAVCCLQSAGAANISWRVVMHPSWGT